MCHQTARLSAPSAASWNGTWCGIAESFFRLASRRSRRGSACSEHAIRVARLAQSGSLPIPCRETFLASAVDRCSQSISRGKCSGARPACIRARPRRLGRSSRRGSRCVKIAAVRRGQTFWTSARRPILRLSCPRHAELFPSNGLGDASADRRLAGLPGRAKILPMPDHVACQVVRGAGSRRLTDGASGRRSADGSVSNREGRSAYRARPAARMRVTAPLAHR